MDGLTEGRIVHYVMPNGEHRPAIVVRVWSTDGVCEGYVNLQVFTDGANDLRQFAEDEADVKRQVTLGQLWRTSICHSQDKQPGTWHWIERA